MSFKELSKIDNRTKDAVQGWIRNQEKSLNIRNVASMIKAICILYYREFDVFDKDSIGSIRLFSFTILQFQLQKPAEGW